VDLGATGHSIESAVNFDGRRVPFEAAGTFARLSISITISNFMIVAIADNRSSAVNSPLCLFFLIENDVPAGAR